MLLAEAASSRVGRRWVAVCVSGLIWVLPAVARAQAPPPPVPPAATVTSRAELIAGQQAAKARNLRPRRANRAEALVRFVEEQFISGSLHWHPFFESAYLGGGFTLGAGYLKYVSAYNSLDVRGSLTLQGYKRVEAEFRAPRLLGRRAQFTAVGGWREATEVGFFGLGTAATSPDDRSLYSFSQPYGSARLEVRPTRGALVVAGGVELSEWRQSGADGASPSVDEVYTPDDLPGLGGSPTYLHTHATVGFDRRQAGAGYARRGGYYAVTLRDYADRGGPYSFRQVDYDVIQHVPILRDAWVVSLRGRVETTYERAGEVVPFFMLPGIGGGSSLRGYSSWRFRDRHSLLLSAEWRVLVNSFVDTVMFYDAGKAVARRGDLDLRGLKSDFGIGLRMHGPAATPVRIELARSNEGLRLVFGASAAF